MRVRPVPALRDNYAYLVIDDARRAAAVVDPSEAEAVAGALEAEGVALDQVWLTHHHYDHVGGVEALVDAAGGDVPVLGSVYDLEHKRIPRQTRGLREGDTFPFAGEEVRVLEIPGHTLGALAFVIAGNVFSGDTLFVAGCGRVFEGTMPMMRDSLAKLRALPGETKLWCGHEYTVKNLEYARTVEPGSRAIAEALDEARAAREAGRFTVPGHLARELEINPFLRFDVPEVARGRDPVTTFAELRDGKDRF